MSQMKPYCFKCGAELDPEAIYCPDCGRLQRSMVVRAVETGPRTARQAPPPPAPPAPPQGGRSYADQSQYPDPSQQHSDQAEAHPGQQEPQDDLGWYPAGGGNQAVDPESAAEDRVYAQRPYPQQPFPDQPYPAQEYPEQPYQAPDDAYAAENDAHAAPGDSYADPDQTHRLPDQAYAPQEPAAAEHGSFESGYSEHGYPQLTYPEQSYPEQGYPEQDHPEQGYPEQSYPEQGYPDQGYSQQGYTYPGQQYGERSASASDGYPGARDATYGTLSDPYALEEWQRSPVRRQPSRVRLIALAVAGLVGLFLVGLGIGKVVGGSGSPAGPADTVSSQRSAPVATAPPPTTQPTAPPSATATPNQGTGTAIFQRVSGPSIPNGQCSTKLGCPIQVTLKNGGGRGGGTFSLTLTDQAGGGNTIATFSAPIPTTDAGGTVAVTGYATGDKLPDYLKSGGTVYITNVTIKNN
jgi:hypothetical protein